MMPEMKAQYENQKNWAQGQKALSDILLSQSKIQTEQLAQQGKQIAIAKSQVELAETMVTPRVSNEDMKAWREQLGQYFLGEGGKGNTYMKQWAASVEGHENWFGGKLNMDSAAERAHTVYMSTLMGPLAALALQLGDVDALDLPGVQKAIDPATGRITYAGLDPANLTDAQKLAAVHKSSNIQRWGSDMAVLYSIYNEIRNNRSLLQNVGTAGNLPHQTFEQFVSGEWTQHAATTGGPYGWLVGAESGIRRAFDGLNTRYGMSSDKIDVFRRIMHQQLARRSQRIETTGQVLEGQAAAEATASQQRAQEQLYQ